MSEALDRSADYQTKEQIVDRIQGLSPGRFCYVEDLSEEMGMPVEDIETLLDESQAVRRPWRQPEYPAFTSVKNRVSAREVLGFIQVAIADRAPF